MRFYTRSEGEPATARVALVKTTWGFAAIASRQQRLVRLFLPQEKERNLWRGVAKAYPGYERDDHVCLDIQDYLRNYFLENVVSPKGQVDISWASDFEPEVPL